jgi:hypothetical protein
MSICNLYSNFFLSDLHLSKARKSKSKLKGMKFIHDNAKRIYALCVNSEWLDKI